MRQATWAVLGLAAIVCAIAGCGGGGLPAAVPSPGGFVPDHFEAYSPDGLKVAKMVHSTDPVNDGTVGVFDRGTGKLIEYYRSAALLKAFAWHPDSRHFTLLYHYGDPSHYDNEVEIYDLEAQTREPVAVVGVDDPYYHSMRFSQDGRWIVFPADRIRVPRLPG